MKTHKICFILQLRGSFAQFLLTELKVSIIQTKHFSKLNWIIPHFAVAKNFIANTLDIRDPLNAWY